MSTGQIFNLTCPKCGGKLQITSDIDRFACGYCGNELIVQRGGGIVTVAPIVEGLREVKVGVDKTASELAIARLTNEINTLAAQRNESDSVKLTCLVLSIIAGILAFLAVWMWLENFQDATIFGIALVLCLVTYGLYAWSRRIASNRIKPIDQAIAQKAQELQKHQAIVSK